MHNVPMHMRNVPPNQARCSHDAGRTAPCKQAFSLNVHVTVQKTSNKFFACATLPYHCMQRNMDKKRQGYEANRK